MGFKNQYTLPGTSPTSQGMCFNFEQWIYQDNID